MKSRILVYRVLLAHDLQAVDPRTHMDVVNVAHSPKTYQDNATSGWAAEAQRSADAAVT